jgi:hypothetical protein
MRAHSQEMSLSVSVAPSSAFRSIKLVIFLHFLSIAQCLAIAICSSRIQTLQCNHHLICDFSHARYRSFISSISQDACVLLTATPGFALSAVVPTSAFTDLLSFHKSAILTSQPDASSIPLALRGIFLPTMEGNSQANTMTTLWIVMGSGEGLLVIAAAIAASICLWKTAVGSEQSQ